MICLMAVSISSISIGTIFTSSKSLRSIVSLSSFMTSGNSQINKIILKYNDKLSYKEQENFKALIYDKNLDFESLMKILNLIISIQKFTFKQKKCLMQ